MANCRVPVTVTIGGRELEIHAPTLAFLSRADELKRIALAAQGNTSLESKVDALLDGLLIFLGHNPGCTKDWLCGVLSLADAQRVLGACIASLTAAATPRKGMFN